MSRFRNILLSGLVALLMVGMGSAGDVDSTTPAADVNAGINIYVGTWNPAKTDCLPVGATDCVNIGISFDFTWLKDLFN